MGGYAVNEGIVPDRPGTLPIAAWESHYFSTDPNRYDDAALYIPRPIPDLVRIHGFQGRRHSQTVRTFSGIPIQG